MLLPSESLPQPPIARLGALLLGFHDMWFPAGDAQPHPTHTEHSAWHIVGIQPCVLKEDSKVGTGDHVGPGVRALVEKRGKAPSSDIPAHSPELAPMYSQLGE